MTAEKKQIALVTDVADMRLGRSGRRERRSMLRFSMQRMFTKQLKNTRMWIIQEEAKTKVKRVSVGRKRETAKHKMSDRCERRGIKRKTQGRKWVDEDDSANKFMGAIRQCVKWCRKMR